MREHLIWIVQGVFFTLFIEAVALILMAWRANQEKREKEEVFRKMVEEKLAKETKENGGIE